MPELSKGYEPQLVESKWYEYWLENRYFVANPDSRKPAFSMVIPPPNVTGILHLGHVLNTTIQDVLCRKARMEGKEVLWLPGTDHAGIATQMMVERKLKKAWRNHYQPAQETRLLLRLDPRAFHDGSGLLAESRRDIRRSLSQRSDLQRAADGQLVPGLANGSL
jgi:hypothetical protein